MINVENEFVLEEETARIDSARDLAVSRLTDEVNKLVNMCNITQKIISKKMNTSEPQISRLLNATNKNKTLDQLVRIAAALGFEVRFEILKNSLPSSNPYMIENKFMHLNESDVVKDRMQTVFKGLK